MDSTHIFNDDPYMRGKSIITIAPDVQAQTWLRDMDEGSVTDPSNITIQPVANYCLNYDSEKKRCNITFSDGLAIGTEYIMTVRGGLVKSDQQTELQYDKQIAFTAAAGPCDTSGINLVTGVNSASADVHIANNQSVEMNPCLVTALYENNTMIDMKIQHGVISPGQAGDLQIPVIQVPSGMENYYFIAFLWDGSDTLKPLVSSVRKEWNEISSMAVYPAADSYIRNGGSYQAVNYGSEEVLVVKNGSSGFYRKAYLKFDLTSVSMPVKGAKLRLYGNDTASGASSVEKVYQVTNDSWQESAINWTNAPAMGALIGYLSMGSTPQYVDINVTSYIAEQMAGDKTVSFGLDTGSSDFVSINSRESADNLPELLLDF